MDERGIDQHRLKSAVQKGVARPSLSNPRCVVVDHREGKSGPLRVVLEARGKVVTSHWLSLSKCMKNARRH